MAIEPMKKLWLIVLKEDAAEVFEHLYHLGCVHLAQAPGHARRSGHLIRRAERELGVALQRLGQLRTILDVFQEFVPSKKDLLSDLLGLPLEVRGSALRRGLQEVEPASLAQRCSELRQEYQETESRLSQVRRLLELWGPISGSPITILCSQLCEHTSMIVGWIPKRRRDALEEVPEEVAWEVLLEADDRLLLGLATPKEEAELLSRLASELDLVELRMPEGYPNSGVYLKSLSEDEAQLLIRRERIREQVRRLAGQRDEILALLGYWERVERRLTAVGEIGFLQRAAVICGYVREKDLTRVTRYLDAQAGGVAVYEEPEPGEQVPVSLQNSKIFGPAEFLVKMFGLPEYFSFDPTPYLMFSFLLFFGICFGDAVYGLVQIGLALWLARKVWDYVSLRQLFLLFAYAGVATFVVGVLTGSWCSDLWRPEYLGEGNFLLRIKESTAVFEPLDKPVIALVVALALGVVNQLWGIVLRTYGSARRGDYAGAVFDGGLWLAFLPGIVLLVWQAMVEGTPHWVFPVGLWMVLGSAVGLVLTQGRHEKGLIAKALTGLVSLYGIMGTYGTTTFVGDVLSYSRLLALGLTTTIVGLSFNIVGGLVRDALGPVGIVAFVVVLVLGHAFNFGISILGGFVHSARLIFVEFFGRFYEGGAPEFSPFGAETGTVQVVEET